MKHLVTIHLEFETSALSNMTPKMEKKFSQTLAFVMGTAGVEDVYKRLASKFNAKLNKMTVVGAGVVGEDVSPMEGGKE